MLIALQKEIKQLNQSPARKTNYHLDKDNLIPVPFTQNRAWVMMNPRTNQQMTNTFVLELLRAVGSNFTDR